ncbi:MAG TPA: MATE family efflux transporter [Clostridia bacterium]|nr:MATE family efflux transporter [Clostridia bacterium]
MIPDKSEKGLIKCFFGYSVPCIVGMFFTSFITIVDGIFIGNRLGGRGLAAVNLTLPVLYLLLGITIMIGIGGVTLATQSLGAGDRARAGRRFTLTLVLCVAVILPVVLLLRVFLDDIVFLLGSGEMLKEYVSDYLGTISFFYPFMMMNIIFSMFVRGEGKPKTSLFFGAAGNIINIVLDYLFIYRLDYGIKGAALASGIAVLLPFLIGCVYFVTGRSAYRPVKPGFDEGDIKSIFFNGSSEFIGQISICITTCLFNYVILRRIGVDGVAAFTIIGYVSFIEYMIITGIAQGINTLVSYSFGARDRGTIERLLSIAVKTTAAIGAVAFIISLAASERIAGLFSGTSSGIVEIAGIGMKIYAFAFLLNGYNMIASSYFTSLGDARTSAVISALRSLLLISVFILVLPHLLGDTGIWLAVPLTEMITFAVSLLCISRSGSKLQFTDI